jgi:hypothetical protein
MLGLYDNFPPTIQRNEHFVSLLSKKKLQQTLIQTIQKLNKETLTFEEVGNPTIPNSQIIFEFGIADGEDFCYFDEEEAHKLQNLIENDAPQIMDWFCLIRYYKINEKRIKQPLKFDYYMIRIEFGEKGTVETQVFHERGPRYISPQDLVVFIAHKLNGLSTRKTLRSIDQD